MIVMREYSDFLEEDKIFPCPVVKVACVSSFALNCKTGTVNEGSIVEKTAYRIFRSQSAQNQPRVVLIASGSFFFFIMGPSTGNGTSLGSLNLG